VDIVAALVILAAIAAVAWLVWAPLRWGGERMQAEVSDRVAELRSHRDAKYREIRDAELDMQTGKLSAEDHRALDRQLRAEAMEILRELDEAEG
jgi:type II secretory pathway component PulM